MHPDCLQPNIALPRLYSALFQLRSLSLQVKANIHWSRAERILGADFYVY
jgi:hypothetical protein